MATEPPTAYEKPPTGKTKARVLRFLGLLIAFQLIVPLTYYVRDDRYDERFAWRMFSAVRLHTCRTSATEETGSGARPIRLGQVVHRAWANHMSRNRRDVVHAFLRRRCDEESVERVTVRNDCVATDGTPLEPQVYERECATGAQTEPDGLEVAP